MVLAALALVVFGAYDSYPNLEAFTEFHSLNKSPPYCSALICNAVRIAKKLTSAEKSQTNC